MRINANAREVRLVKSQSAYAHELRNSRVDVIARNAYISVMRSPCRATVAAACTAMQWHLHAWGNRPAVRVTQFLTGFQETPIPRSRDVAGGKRTFSPGSLSATIGREIVQDYWPDKKIFAIVILNP